MCIRDRSNIETTIIPFENATFEWDSPYQVTARFLPFIELNDQDHVSISGLSTDIFLI